MQPRKGRDKPDIDQAGVQSHDLAVAVAIADESRDGIVLFDDEGLVLHQNAAATALLSESSFPKLQKTLQTTCASVLRVGKRSQFELNGFAMVAAPLPSSKPLGILTIWLRLPLPTESELRDRFGFTPREAEVALLLAERRTDAEIASTLGISWHTVRTHVERIFSVLECHSRRQAADRLAHRG